MTLIALIIFLTIGILAGFLSGLLGVGGGVVVVPGLFFTFHLLGFHSSHTMQLAAGTSLAAMIFTTASSARSHYLQNGIKWDLFLPLVPGIIIGAASGAFLAVDLPSKTLVFLFGWFLCLVGTYFLLFSNVKEIHSRIKRPRNFVFSIIGLIIGTISTALGIGGGVITVPILTAIQVPLRSAISISALTSLLMAIIGSISFFYLGIKSESMEGGLGFVYLPAFLCIGFTSTIVAHFAALLSYSLPIVTLKRFFGIFLMGVGTLMIIR